MLVVVDYFECFFRYMQAFSDEPWITNISVDSARTSNFKFAKIWLKESQSPYSLHDFELSKYWIALHARETRDKRDIASTFPQG